MTNYEKLDEAAKELGSPPAELHIQALLKEARARFPELKRCRDDSLAATMDYQTINIRGRTQWAGDFKRRARWNRHPAFLKTNPATYRRLSEGERRRFGELWQAGADLLKRPEYEAWEWENLRDSRVGGPPHA